MGVLLLQILCILLMVKECSDQGVDGETLQTLVAQGSVEQLRECELLTIKQQMQLKKSIQSLDPTPTPGPSPSTTTSSHTQLQDLKPIKKELARLTKKELARLPLEENILDEVRNNPRCMFAICGIVGTDASLPN